MADEASVSPVSTERTVDGTASESTTTDDTAGSDLKAVSEGGTVCRVIELSFTAMISGSSSLGTSDCMGVSPLPRLSDGAIGGAVGAASADTSVDTPPSISGLGRMFGMSVGPARIDRVGD